MNVYPVNAVEGAILSSPNTQSYSKMEYLYNKIISFQADFNNSDITINGNWNFLEEVDAVIIGNTNAKTGKLKLYKDNEIEFETNFTIDNYIEIISIKNQFGLLETKGINNFVIQLSGNENISLGYLFIGKTWTLPRFLVAPNRGLTLRNESDRTFYGQVTGIPKETLKRFACAYCRIDNKDKKKFDDYVNGVQTVIPHIIDPYSEAHEEFEPFFATVSEYGEAAKREENGFYWDFSCSWQEAK